MPEHDLDRQCPIDLDAAREYAGEDEALLRELFAVFLEEARGHVAALHECRHHWPQRILARLGCARIWNRPAAKSGTAAGFRFDNHRQELRSAEALGFALSS